MFNFYKFITFSNFATSLLGIFIPVYLLENNILLIQIIIFSIILGISKFLTQNLFYYLLKFTNIKQIVNFSYILTISYYILIYNFQTLNINIYFISFLYGIGFSLFWLSYHILFSEYGTNSKRGEQTSLTFILRSASSFIAPFVATLILIYSNYFYLFLFVIIVLLLNTYNLNQLQSVTLNSNPSFLLIYKKELREYIAFFGHGILIGSGILWSIYIYVEILNNFVLLGLVTFVSLLVATLTRVIIGKVTDKYPRKTLVVGAISNNVVWVIKPFLTTSFGIFIIDFFDGITDSLKNIPFNSKSYNDAKNGNALFVNIFRESLISLGYMVPFLIYFLTLNFKVTFLIAAFSSLLYLFKK